MLKGFFNNNKEPIQQAKVEDIDLNNIPEHIAIIMDGNGRWAKSKGLPRVAGHRAGMKAVKEVARTANKLGVKILTLYAFSTENWKRPEQEVKFLMDLPQEFLAKEIDELIENNVRITWMGFEENIPSHTLEAVKEAERKTEQNTGLVLNFALNYGSRYEMLQAVKSVLEDIEAKNISKEEINEEIFEQYLLTRDYPDPDLLIRTSGEQRISNFLLWQLAYSELWFTPIYWPEFNQNHFIQALYEYQHRGRRFGGL